MIQVTICSAKIITTFGYGTIVEDDLPKARDEALRDAFKNAIEQGLGVQIQAQTEVERFQLVKQIVLTESKGYIKSYKILSEDPTNSMGYAVQIEAEVVEGKISDQNALKLLIELMGNPRVMVLIEEEHDKTPAGSSPIGELLTTKLTNVGYQTVDPTQVEQIRQRDILKEALAGQTKNISVAAGRLGTEVLIVGKATAWVTGSVEAGGFPIVTARAKTHIDVIVAETGQIVYSLDSKEMKGSAGQRVAAMRKAIDATASGLIKELTWQLPTKFGGPVHITCTINGVSFSQVQNIKKCIQRLRNVLSVQDRGFNNSSVEFDIRTTDKTQDLAGRIVQLKNPSLEITTVGLGIIKATVQK